MTDTRPPLAAFDDETLDAVAGEAHVEPATLESLVVRHQERVRTLPGVEDVVYEWRSQFHEDPLVHQTETAYVLAHRPHVWDEYVADLDLNEAEGTALRAVHDHQAQALAPPDVAARFDSSEAMVLTRP